MAELEGSSSHQSSTGLGAAAKLQGSSSLPSLTGTSSIQPLLFDDDDDVLVFTSATTITAENQRSTTQSSFGLSTQSGFQRLSLADRMSSTTQSGFLRPAMADRMSSTQSVFGLSTQSGFQSRRRPWLHNPWCKLKPLPAGKEKTQRGPLVPADKWTQASTILQSSVTALPMLRKPSAHTTKPLKIRDRRSLPNADSEESIDAPKSKVPEISPVQKKLNAQQALARDRATRSSTKHPMENPDVTQARQQPVEDRLWQDIFHPILHPQEYLPLAYRAHPALPPSKNTTPLQRMHDPLELHEGEGLLYVCREFAGLVKQFAGFDSDPLLILTRPAFCRMLVALRLSGANGRPVYSSAVALFDSVAEKFPIRGATTPTGYINGLKLDVRKSGLKKVPARDLPVADLFCVILEEVAMATQGTSSLEDRLAFVKKVFFTEQLPRAASHAKNRQEQLQKLLGLGMDASGPKGARSAVGSENAVDQKEAMDQPSEMQTLEPRRGSKATTDSEDLNEIESRGWSESNAEESPQASKMTRADQSRKGSTTGMADIPEVTTQKLGSKAAATDKVKDQHPYEDKSVIKTGDVNSSEPPVEDQASEKVGLYAHTFAVTKGELLTSMLMEPEVVQFTAQFEPAFRNIFTAYSDIPTGFIGDSSVSGGHMSINAFIRFCVDFKLFSEIVDFCTMQFIYHSAECWQDIDKGSIVSKLHRGSIGQQNQLHRGDTVELDGGKKEKGCLGRGEVGLILDSKDGKCLVQDSRRRQSWYSSKGLRMGQQPYIVQDEQNDKYAGGRMPWLQKDFSRMNATELGCLTLLTAIDDWLMDQKRRTKDIFGILDESKDGHLDAKEFLRGIRFMQLENTPELNDLEAVIALIDPDGDGTVDIWELDTVLLICRERKSRHKKSLNLFLKEESEMSNGELAASRFFTHLEELLCSRGWNAKDFFNQFDTDKSESLSADELLAAAIALGFPPELTPELEDLKRGLRYVDPNFDGQFTLKELHRCFAQVREAREAREPVKKEEPLSAFLSLPQDTATPVKIFGAKAFVETLLKIGLMHLSFHGKVIQAEQMAHTKVLWLICYLHSAFQKQRTKYRMVLNIEHAGVNLHTPVDHTDDNKVDKWHHHTESTGETLGEVVHDLKENWGLQMKGSSKDLNSPHGSQPEERKGSKEQPRRKGSKEQPRRKGSKEQQELISKAAAAISPEQNHPDGLKRRAAFGKARLQSYVRKKGYAKYLPPLRRLMIQFPNLFNEVPVQVPEPLRALEATNVCSGCGKIPYRGWGNLFCLKCSHADDILKACMESENPAEFPALHPLLRD